MKSVVITGFGRTPIGSFLGSLRGISAPQLGAQAIRHALEAASVHSFGTVDQVILGNVLSSGMGQAPARQAALAAGIPTSTDVFGVNKVCSSGMKAVTLGAQSIMTGESQLSVVGGMESMSNVPFVLPSACRSEGLKYGHRPLQDLILQDGLFDPYHKAHMGCCAEKTAKEMGISRQDQDEYAIESYRRAKLAWREGRMERECYPVKSTEKNQTLVVDKDEEFSKLKLEKVSTLKPAFLSDTGTITAANASKLNDGAAALVIAAEDYAAHQGMLPIARIESFADFACEPIDFSLAPAGAARKALKKAGMSPSDIDFWEINEAFSSVALANILQLQIDPDRVNVDGGAVALGHPIGMSGARLVMSAARILLQRDAATACVAICNGGGGATAVVLQRL